MNLVALLEIAIVVFVYVYISFQCFYKKKWSNYFIWSTLIFFFLIRSRDFYLGYYNPDELQWIISANSFYHNAFEYCNYFAFSEFSRSLTILPLIVVGAFSEYIGILEARLLNILLFCLFFWLMFKILKKVYKDEINAKITVFILAFCLAFGFRGDIYCFNSEVVVINLLAASFLFFLKSQFQRNGFKYILIASIFSCLIPFAKDQALPLAIAMYIYYLITVLKCRKHALYLLIFPGIIAILFVTHILLTNSFRTIILMIDFANNYAKSGAYSNNSSFIQKSITFIRNNYFETCNGTLLILFLFGLIVMLFRKIKKRRKVNKIEYLIFITFLACAAISVLPGNGFYHYSFYFFFSFPFFIYYLLKYVVQFRILIVLCILFTSLKSGVIHNKTFFPLSGLFKKRVIEKSSDEVTNYLTKNLSKNDKLLVWGWELKYYLETRTQRSTFAIVPVFLDSKSKDKSHWINIYIHDILKYKPKFILETVGPGRFYFYNKKIWSIENVSKKLMNKIKNSYTLTKSGENFRIFKIKS